MNELNPDLNTSKSYESFPSKTNKKKDDKLPQHEDKVIKTVSSDSLPSNLQSSSSKTIQANKPSQISSGDECITNKLRPSMDLNSHLSQPGIVSDGVSDSKRVNYDDEAQPSKGYFDDGDLSEPEDSDLKPDSKRENYFVRRDLDESDLSEPEDSDWDSDSDIDDEEQLRSSNLPPEEWKSDETPPDLLLSSQGVFGVVTENIPYNRGGGSSSSSTSVDNLYNIGRLSSSSSIIEFFDTDIRQFQEEKLLEERTKWELQEIIFDREEIMEYYRSSPNEEKAATLKEKAAALSKEFYKLSPEDCQFMAGFIERNRQGLMRMTEDGNRYLRSEVSGLPLSALITSEGKIFWMVAAQAKEKLQIEPGNFKKIEEGIEHDSLKSFITGILKTPTKKAFDAAMNELKIGYRLLNVPNTAQLIDTMTYDSTSSPSSNSDFQDTVVVLITRYPKGDLSEHRSLSDEIKTKITKGVINGGNEIHKLNILHGDFKVENIFLDEDYTPYIGDFGCAREFSQLGTPECTYHIQNSHEHPGVALADNETFIKNLPYQDVYQMGLALAQMELGLSQLPWESSDPKGLMQLEAGQTLMDAVKSFYNKFPVDTPRRKLIKKLINPEIDKIPTMEQAKEISSQL